MRAKWRSTGDPRPQVKRLVSKACETQTYRHEIAFHEPDGKENICGPRYRTDHPPGSYIRFRVVNHDGSCPVSVFCQGDSSFSLWANLFGIARELMTHEQSKRTSVGSLVVAQKIRDPASFRDRGNA